MKLTSTQPFLLLLILNFLAFGLVAQHQHTGACGTHDQGPRLSAWLQAFQARTAEAKIRASRSTYEIPMKIHIVGTDEGKGYYDLDDLFESMCNLNRNYEGTGLSFYIDGDIHYIDNSNYHSHDYTYGRDMMNRNNVDSAINVYFCEQAVEGNCGYFDPSADAVAITNSCQLNDATTLTHELGHYLSLPHTFYGWEGRSFDENPVRETRREKQDGSNCRWTADGFCDTPPDYHSSRWSCPFDFGYTDPDGQEIQTDGEFYMSYSNDACQTKFSEEQIQAMVANVSELRTDLIREEVSQVSTLELAELVHPKHQEYNVPENYVALAWNPVEGADYYHLQVARLSFRSAAIDTIVNENYLVTENILLFDKEYKWRVKPIAKGVYCTEFSEEREFVVTWETNNPDTTWNVWNEDTINSVQDIVANKLQLFPNPVETGSEIYIDLNASMGETVTIEIRDVVGKLVFTEERRVTNRLEKILLEDLKSGVYITDVVASDKLYSNKLIIE